MQAQRRKSVWIFVAMTAFIAVCLYLALPPRQRIIPLNARARVQTGGMTATAPLPDDRLVLLDVDDFGYTAYVPLEAEELSYDGIYARAGVLTRGEPHNRLPLVIRARTRAALNLERSTSHLHAQPHPLLLDHLPWRYTTRGAPYAHAGDWRKTRYCLRHDITLTAIAADGTAIVQAGKRQLVLQPGGKAVITSGKLVWNSTVTLHHRGVFRKGRVEKSQWLKVE